MCGITGLWLSRPLTATGQNLRQAVQAMTDSLSHRGPDDQGLWLDEDRGLGLGHRRLSIIDLSPTGSQPMVSASGKSVIVYNGELYNTPELRASLEKSGTTLTGTSDTQVLLELLERDGIAAALAQLNGIFAFAYFDRVSGSVYLARDTVGIKPLYWSYCPQHEAFSFASELKALVKSPLWRGSICRAAAADFFSYGYIGGTNAIYKNTHKLKAGHYLCFKQGQSPVIKPYEFKTQTVRLEANQPAIKYLTALLQDSVKRQLVSDVPLGVFLSGGIDSSLITALMCQTSKRPVKTFTIGFEEDTHNEAEHAAKIARHLGTDHTDHIFNAAQAQALISDLPEIYDEPFADSSQLPTLLVSRLARGHVTVCLSGDGGDELFAGYNRYFYGSRLLARIYGLPAKALLSGALKMPLLQMLARRLTKQDNADFKLQKLAAMLQTRSFAEQYKILCQIWPLQVPAYDSGIKQNEEGINGMRRADLDHYLPDDILTKVDRASMAHGLEVRVPFLDPRLIKLAFDIPLEQQISGTTGKLLLRQILAQYIPEPLFARPKSGFSVPMNDWLRTGLKDWAADLLNDPSLKDIDALGLTTDAGKHFGHQQIRKRWQQHQSKTHNWQHALWAVLMWQAWRRHWGF